MANNRAVYQQVTNVSINKDKLIDIATNGQLTETDLRVLLCLFTELNGWVDSPHNTTKDPFNFKMIDRQRIADLLGIKKKKVKESIYSLMDQRIIEPGASDTVDDGWRFTF